MLKAQAYERREIDVLADAYSLSRKLNIEQKSFNTKKIVGKEKNQIIVKDTVNIDGDSPEIAQVFNVLSKPSMLECNIGEGTVTLEGAVNNSILYLANNSELPISCYDCEVPFKQNIEVNEINPKMNCEVELEVEHCNYSMISASEVEIRVIINVCIKVIDSVQLPLITKVTENPLEDKKTESPSIVL
jgi:hypothetical protein